jgi:curved DNA-binding protein CbpA
MASRFHPDNPETGDPEKFLTLQAAYETLSDPKRREAYDASLLSRDPGTIPIFELSEFVNGIEGEMNRRLGILSLLYNRRRTSPQNPGISVLDLEKRMGMPREYLDFTTWYLKSKHLIGMQDNSEFVLTADGVDYVESQCASPILQRLLEAGPRSTTSASTRRNGSNAHERLQLTAPPPKSGPHS